MLENFKFTASGTTTNQPPTVAITSPTGGSTFTAGNNVTVTAAANDSDGTVSRVDFFVGTTQIGSDATAPYSAAWSNVAAGGYNLTAKAVDNDGASTTSVPLLIYQLDDRQVSCTSSPLLQEGIASFRAAPGGYR